MKKTISLFIAIAMLLSLAACGGSGSSAGDYETALFGQDVISVDITVDPDEWQDMLDNATQKPSVTADVSINGENYEDVSIKPKGNTSLTQVASTDSDRFSLKINFGKNVEGQTCHGLDKLALNNIYGDSTYLKEYMSYALFAYMDVPASLCSFAEITVNGEHYGFCLAVEDADESYLERNFGSDYGEAYKPESMDMGGGDFGGGQAFDPNTAAGGEDGTTPTMPTDGTTPTMPSGDSAPEGFDPSNMQLPEGMTIPENFDPGDMQGFGGRGGMNGGSGGVDMVYTDDDPSSYSNIFDEAITDVTEDDEARLIASLKAISEGESIETNINVDEVLRYAAVNVFLVNLDSYFSSMGHNYILYEDAGQISMLPWDYNLSFGTFEGTSAQEAVNYAIDSVFSSGISFEDRPVIGKLLENEEYLEIYHGYLRQLCEYVTSGSFAERVDTLAKTIDSYVQADTTSFDGYDAFVSGTEALKLFTQLRAESVLGQLEGTIPSTTEQQSGSDALVDASEMDMSLLGSMANGGGRNGFDGNKQKPDTGRTQTSDAPAAETPTAQ